jgi:GNAT superfamily N-acetyltransferase
MPFQAFFCILLTLLVKSVVIEVMQFSDLALARRLERAEGHACLRFAEARRRKFPQSGAEWKEIAGAYAVFDSVGSPITQSFGLGLFEELSEASLDAIESFFMERGAAVMNEVSPLAGVAALALLCRRGYRPLELSSVLYRAVEDPVEEWTTNVQVRVVGAQEESIWTEINAKGWSHEHPELLEFLVGNGALVSMREDSVCFLAEMDGVPGAAGALSIYQGTALFGGATTVPELRGRGLQGALLAARMRYAFEQGCDLAMMVSEVGTGSQRNAERKGFRIAYTRTKWSL